MKKFGPRKKKVSIKSKILRKDLKRTVIVLEITIREVNKYVAIKFKKNKQKQKYM